MKDWQSCTAHRRFLRRSQTASSAHLAGHAQSAAHVTSLVIHAHGCPTGVHATLYDVHIAAVLCFGAEMVCIERKFEVVMTHMQKGSRHSFKSRLTCDGPCYASKACHGKEHGGKDW